MEARQIDGNRTTLERIHQAARREFLEKGYKDASLRNIVKSVGMTTGAFYGYYKSKEELFEALVCEHYAVSIGLFSEGAKRFCQSSPRAAAGGYGRYFGACMFEMLHYAYEHLEECKLILCCSEGTKFSGPH